jgi:hypothetical protein
MICRTDCHSKDLLREIKGEDRRNVACFP